MNIVKFIWGSGLMTSAGASVYFASSGFPKEVKYALTDIKNLRQGENIQYLWEINKWEDSKDPGGYWIKSLKRVRKNATGKNTILELGEKGMRDINQVWTGKACRLQRKWDTSAKVQATLSGVFKRNKNPSWCQIELTKMFKKQKSSWVWYYGKTEVNS